MANVLGRVKLFLESCSRVRRVDTKGRMGDDLDLFWVAVMGAMKLVKTLV